MANCSPFKAIMDVTEVVKSVENGITTERTTKYTLYETESGSSYKVNSATHHLRCINGEWVILTNMPNPPLNPPVNDK
jgi:hypothetical protein